MHYYCNDYKSSQCVETKIKLLQNTEVISPIPKHPLKFIILMDRLLHIHRNWPTARV